MAKQKKKKHPRGLDKWLDNFIRLSECGTVGACPYCKSENTHYGYVAFSKSDIGWGAVWCDDCKHGVHLCRVKIEDGQNMGEPIPQDIIY